MSEVFEFADAAALAATLAERVAQDLRSAIGSRGRASLAVSGGRTPTTFLSILSMQALDWSSVEVTLTDERWVDPGHVDSNEGMVRRHLLRRRAAAASFFGLKNAAPTACEGEAACEAMLATMSIPFDVVVLGMGADGHTASLFPQAPQLPRALDLRSGKRCIAIDPVTASHPRISLTLPALLDSGRIVVLIAGAAKAEVLRAALQPGPVEALPIRAILQQARVPVDVYWTRDDADPIAASR